MNIRTNKYISDSYTSPAQKKTGVLTFALPSIMNIETAEVLAAEFKQMPLSEQHSLVLDASQVETITTPGLQLIVSLEKELTAQGGSLIITGQRETFTHALRDTGLENLLNKPA